MDLIGHIKKMYEHELYANVLPLVSILLTAHKTDRQLLTADQHIEVLILYANSLYVERQFTHAEIIYREVLKLKQSKSKSGDGNTTNSSIFEFPIHEIKYRIAVCLDALYKYNMALQVLTSIPNNQRTPKINMFLGRLKQALGYMDAANTYKEVLRECPLNLEAIKALLASGVKGIEVNSIVVDMTQHPQCLDWLTNYIKGLALMYSGNFPAAMDVLRSIVVDSKVGKNELLLSQIGECALFMGDTDMATGYLVRAKNANPYSLDYLENLALCYAKKDNLDDLARLAENNILEYKSEQCFVMATLYLAKGLVEKAVYYAINACHKNPRSIEAQLMKAKIFFELRRHNEALAVYIRIQPIAYYRFDVYKGIIDVYVATHRFREAQVMVGSAIRNLGQKPRVLVLAAHTFHVDLLLKYKAKPALNKALDLDPYYLPAVVMMADILRSEGKVKQAIELLRGNAEHKKNANLYALLGDIQAAEKDFESATRDYTMAINLMPMNKRAINGLLAIGQPLSRLNDSYVSSSIVDDTSEFQESICIDELSQSHSDQDVNNWRDVIQRLIGSSS